MARVEPHRNAVLVADTCDCGRVTMALEGEPVTCHVCAMDAWLGDLHRELAESEGRRRVRESEAALAHLGDLLDRNSVSKRFLAATGMLKGGRR